MYGLYATPDYIREHGIKMARFMTRIIDGITLEEVEEMNQKLFKEAREKAEKKETSQNDQSNNKSSPLS